MAYVQIRYGNEEKTRFRTTTLDKMWVSRHRRFVVPTKPSKPNPYCMFKDDKQRLRALISRDLRYVIIAALVVAHKPSSDVSPNLASTAQHESVRALKEKAQRLR